jgi:hypothetical protein
MKVAVAAFGLLGLVGLVGCVRTAETTVREKAADTFGCAHYELTVVEVGPDVYRATGCGQELIYACRSARAASGPDGEDEPVVSCLRTPE